MFRKLSIILGSLSLTSCSFNVVGPEQLADLPAGLKVDFSVEPSQVKQGEPFTAHLEVTNTTSDTITVVTGHGCLVLPNVIRGGKRYPFMGTAWGCTAAITTHVFAPGKTTTRTWEMRAALYAENPGDVEGAPAPSGDYLVQAVFETAPVDESGRRPTVEAALRVQ